MRRVVAVLGAVLLVVVAIVARGALDGDDDSGGGGSSGGDGSDGDPGISLVCIEELQAVCEALEADGAIEGFDTEAAGDTVNRLAVESPDLGADAWLTFDPFPGIADVARGEAGFGPALPEVTSSTLATPVVIATAPDRTDAWRDACGGDADWACLGDVAGEQWSDHSGEASWNDIEVAFDDPSSSAVGLLVAAQAVATHVGDPAFSRNDLEGGDTLRWLRNLTDDLRPGETGTLGRMITQRGSLDAVGALSNEAAVVADSRQGDGTGIFYPAPMYAAEVVLAAPTGSVDDLLDQDALRDALDGDGWSRPEAVELPDAGTFYALREELS